MPPRYPDGTLAKQEDRGTRRVQLSIWMASRDNPYLPKAAVNRVWSHMFGRGLVEPVDDLGKHNPASHPELFDELTELARQVMRAGLRAQYPDASEQEIKKRYVDRLLAHHGLSLAKIRELQTKERSMEPKRRG